jgi:outer membrane protein insertion porin family
MRSGGMKLMLGMTLVATAPMPLLSQTAQEYRIGEVKIIGNNFFSVDITKLVLGLVPGQVYNETALKKGFGNLTKLYGSQGYVNFAAVPMPDYDEGKKLVNLTINIDEDRQFKVGHITFTGNTTKSDNIISRELLIREGYIFNTTSWDLSIQRLNRRGWFEQIKSEDAEIKLSATEPILDINLKVKEKRRKRRN